MIQHIHQREKNNPMKHGVFVPKKYVSSIADVLNCTIHLASQKTLNCEKNRDLKMANISKHDVKTVSRNFSSHVNQEEL